MSRGLKLESGWGSSHLATPSRQLPMSRGLKRGDLRQDRANWVPSRQLPMSRGLKPDLLEGFEDSPLPVKATPDE